MLNDQALGIGSDVAMHTTALKTEKEVLVTEGLRRMATVVVILVFLMPS